VSDSPIEQLLAAIHTLDADEVMALLAPDVRMLAADGRHAEGAEAARALVTSFFAPLRSCAHRVIGQWHVDDVWIAEVEADYVLQDWLELKALPRAVFLSTGDAGIARLRFYGAHEHLLSDHPGGEEGMWIAGRWIPPL
jgi:SnoaL-like domain